MINNITIMPTKIYHSNRNNHIRNEFKLVLAARKIFVLYARVTILLCQNSDRIQVAQSPGVLQNAFSGLKSPLRNELIYLCKLGLPTVIACI